MIVGVCSHTHLSNLEACLRLIGHMLRERANGSWFNMNRFRITIYSTLYHNTPIWLSVSGGQKNVCENYR